MRATCPRSSSPTARLLAGDTATLSAKAVVRSRRRRQPLRRIFLRLVPRRAERRRKYGGRRRRPGIDAKSEARSSRSGCRPGCEIPRAYDPGTAMPHYRFNDAQVATLSGFLLAKADSDFLANVHLDAATPEQIAHGKRLVSDYGCASCHEIAGIKKPENFAPELSRIGSKPVTQLIFLPGMPHTLPDYIAGKIKQPRAFSPGLKMPQYTFTPAQIDSLTTALLALNDRSNTFAAIAGRCRHARVGLPARRQSRKADDRSCLLQLPSHQRPRRRHGARPHLGRQFRAARVAGRSSSRIRERCVRR